MEVHLKNTKRGGRRGQVHGSQARRIFSVSLARPLDILSAPERSESAVWSLLLRFFSHPRSVVMYVSPHSWTSIHRVPRQIYLYTMTISWRELIFFFWSFCNLPQRVMCRVERKRTHERSFFKLCTLMALPMHLLCSQWDHSFEFMCICTYVYMCMSIPTDTSRTLSIIIMVHDASCQLIILAISSRVHMSFVATSVSRWSRMHIYACVALSISRVGSIDHTV